jgi:hypothetical protein
MTPEGVLVQWIGFPFVDEALFRSLLAALGEVFRNVRVYVPPPPGSALFIASDGPLEIEESAERALAAAPGDFAPFGLVVGEDVLASLVLDEQGVRELASGAAANRDDHNLLQSRSGVLVNSLQGRFDELVAPVDALTRPGAPGADPFYLLRQLTLPRARRLAAALADPLDREVAAAIVASRRDGSPSLRARMIDALREAPGHRPARAALLRLSQGLIREGLDAEALVEAPLDEAERAVVEGWQAGDGPRLRDLDPALAAVPHRSPLASEANRLRALWRIESGDPALGREAIALADRALSDLGLASDVLLRARACVAAGDHVQALHTLANLAARLRASSGPQRGLAAQGLRVARAIPPDPALEGLRARVERLLGARVGRERRGS